jgi:hypothetical protein
LNHKELDVSGSSSAARELLAKFVAFNTMSAKSNLNFIEFVKALTATALERRSEP